MSNPRGPTLPGTHAGRHVRDERRAFLLAPGRTGHRATVRADGGAHVAPVWFTLDGDGVLFNTGADTVKGRNLTRTGRAALSVGLPVHPQCVRPSRGAGGAVARPRGVPWLVAGHRRQMRPG